MTCGLNRHRWHALLAAALGWTMAWAAPACAGKAFTEFITLGANPSSSPAALTVADGFLYFTADDGIHGREVWRLDTQGNAYLVADCLPGQAGSEPHELTALGPHLAFLARGRRGKVQPGQPAEHLWLASGTEAAVYAHILQRKSTPSNLRFVGNRLVFAQDVDPRGRGIHALKQSFNAGPDRERTIDLCPGRGGVLSKANPELHVLGDFLLFSAHLDPAKRKTPKKALWRSDGSIGGTHPMTMANSEFAPAPSQLAVAGNRAFFNADTEGLGHELWMTDGSPEGTHFVKDIWPGEDSSMAKDFRQCGNRVFFQAHDGTHGIELWCTDGSAENTRLVKDINPGAADSSPAYMRSVGSVMLFSARDGTHGNELWRSDGTPQGTFLVRDIYKGGTGSALYTPTVYRNILLFSANHAVFGEELWRSDGTAEGTWLIKDIHAGKENSEPYWLEEFAGRVYFSANDGIHGEELWATDGTAEGTQLAADLWPRLRPVRSSNPTNLAACDGKLLFAADDVEHGDELWCSDPASKTTRMLKDIRPGAASSAPDAMTPVAGRVFFRADDGEHGTELWTSDGTTHGTTLVADLLPGTPASEPSNLARCNEALVFTAIPKKDEAALFVLAPPYEEPEQRAIIREHVPGGKAVRIAAFAGRCVVCIRRPTGGFAFLILEGDTVRKADVALPRWGRWEGARRLAEKQDSKQAKTFQLDLFDCYLATLDTERGLYALMGAKVFFAAHTREHGHELWHGAGTVASASLLADCFVGPPSGGPRALTVIGEQLYFAAEHASLGREVWRSDGTPRGTRPMQDWQSSGRTSGAPAFLTAFQGRLTLSLFDSGLSTHGRILAEAEVDHPDRLTSVRVRRYGARPPFEPSHLTAVGSYLYFAGHCPARGTELWRSDGTEAGTELVKDLLPDSGYQALSEIR